MLKHIFLLKMTDFITYSVQHAIYQFIGTSHMLFVCPSEQRLHYLSYPALLSVYPSHIHKILVITSALPFFRTFMNYLCPHWMDTVKRNINLRILGTRCVGKLTLMIMCILMGEFRNINPLTAVSRSSGYKLFVTRYRQPAFRIEHYMQNGAVNRCSG